MGIQVTTEPTVEPVSVSEAKDHLRVTSSDDDTYIGTLIKAARQRAEGYTRRALVTQTIQYTMEAFPTEMMLPRPPVASITSINYVDSDGISQSFTDFQSDLADQANPKVKPSYGNSWPTARDQYGAVTVTYVAGYGGGDSPDTITNIPQDIRHAILLMVGTWYENREDAIVGTSTMAMPEVAKNLLHPYRVKIV